MHYGVYEGVFAAMQPRKILILGESHHGEGLEDVGKPGKLPTEEVVKTYLSQKDQTEQRLQFFHKIALAFGIDVGKEQEKALFWDKVFFGNYVDVLCGVGDTAAKRTMEANKETYNQELAEFVNERQIDDIFCFGLGVYDCLPGNHEAGILSDDRGNMVADQVVGKNHSGRVTFSGYLCESSLFDHSVRVYGIPHPSARGGFYPEYFVRYLKPVLEGFCE